MEDDPLSHSHVWADEPTLSPVSLPQPAVDPEPLSIETEHNHYPITLPDPTREITKQASPQLPPQPNPAISPPYENYVGLDFSSSSSPSLGFAPSPFSRAADNASIKPLPPSVKSESDDDSDDGYSSPTHTGDASIANNVIIDPLGSFLQDRPSPAKDPREPRHISKSLKKLQSDDRSRSTLSSPPAQRQPMPDRHPVSQSRTINNKNEQSIPKYMFRCDVTEPMKVSQAMGAYVVYKVRTETNSPSFKSPEVTVNRRFSDFLWLFNQLLNRYPGIIIPPVPEKQALGRFQEEFVESRRAALEQFLRKVVAHPVLQNDDDLRAFLESETFVADKKKQETKGFKGVFSVSSSSSKVADLDQTLESRRSRIDFFEPQLKALSRALDDWQRLQADLSLATHELAISLQHLANVDVNKPISRNLSMLGEIHKQITDIQEKQAKHDITSLTVNVDYYIRVVNSVHLAFASRARAHQTWQSNLTSLQKKRDSLDKLQTARSIRSDKIAATIKEIDELEEQCHNSEKEFQDISHLLKQELERFEGELTGDFIASMREFVADFLESQRTILRLWESYNPIPIE